MSDNFSRVIKGADGSTAKVDIGQMQDPVDGSLLRDFTIPGGDQDAFRRMGINADNPHADFLEPKRADQGLASK